MKPEILHNDHMMFLDRALETQRTALLTAMADAVSECRTAADQAAELTETGEIGLLRLVEILVRRQGPARGRPEVPCWRGTEVQILADVVAQLYACLTECRFVGPLGLAAYAELSSMAASLMLERNGLIKEPRLRFTEEERADPGAGEAHPQGGKGRRQSGQGAGKNPEKAGQTGRGGPQDRQGHDQAGAGG